jgi:hypothetical protein
MAAFFTQNHKILTLQLRHADAEIYGDRLQRASSLEASHFDALPLLTEMWAPGLGKVMARWQSDLAAATEAAYIQR